MTEHRLAGRRVLLVEDDKTVSARIEDMLDKLGCVIVGPFRHLPEAREAARISQVDLALLDVNLVGVLSYPVAEILAERKIPFILLTAYGVHALPADRPDWQWHAKPFQEAELVARIEGLVEQGGI
ncbi:response regulator [Acidisoma cellulosilytica]|uniref:Response regulator n=1 Tax=Acidisoma cellulosilyticum TaxID=2802395 RepID=A0A963Z0H6_9PROT|nr:response regulator [Acidisoma cellulosilyticum]MCB8879575.1 response regulator [Acidisoma cellulosilyticum]